MERRQFTREFKLEAVRLIKHRGVRMHRRQRILVFTRRSCAIG
jgi:transposase-like protein